MDEDKTNGFLAWLVLSLAVVVLDRGTKMWAETVLDGGVMIPVFSWFDFSLVYNRGAAFGFLNDAGGWQNLFFVVLAILVSVFLVWSLYRLKRDERQLAMAYALILGGAIGNVFDRVSQGYVVDFIHWFYQDWHWPHFNIADSAISIGAALMIAEAVGVHLFGRPAETVEKGK
jgi:signal peptidase II